MDQVNHDKIKAETREWANSRFDDLDDERKELLELVISSAKERAADAERRERDVNKSLDKANSRNMYLTVALMVFVLAVVAMVLDRQFNFSGAGTSINVGGESSVEVIPE